MAEVPEGEVADETVGETEVTEGTTVDTTDDLPAL